MRADAESGMLRARREVKRACFIVFSVFPSFPYVMILSPEP
jgi:hypothetical protein